MKADEATAFQSSRPKKQKESQLQYLKSFLHYYTLFIIAKLGQVKKNKHILGTRSHNQIKYSNYISPLVFLNRIKFCLIFYSSLKGVVYSKSKKEGKR
jgi:hypothetical protein